jgi:hypothetical protein
LTQTLPNALLDHEHHPWLIGADHGERRHRGEGAARRRLSRDYHCGVGRGVDAADAEPAPGRRATLVPSPWSSTNIPGGGLAYCTGTVVGTESAPLGERGGVALQVSYADSNGGRTCAMVTKTGTARDRRGELSVTLHLHNYDGRRWPRHNTHDTVGLTTGRWASTSTRRAAAAYAERLGSTRIGDGAVTLTTGKVGCDRRGLVAGSRTPP